jgi:hypothetical protein
MSNMLNMLACSCVQDNQEKHMFRRSSGYPAPPLRIAQIGIIGHQGLAL